MLIREGISQEGHATMPVHGLHEQMASSTAEQGDIESFHREDNVGGDSFDVLISSAGRRVSLMQCWRRSLRFLGLQGRLLTGDMSTMSSVLTSLTRASLCRDVHRMNYSFHAEYVGTRVFESLSQPSILSCRLCRTPSSLCRYWGTIPIQARRP